MSKYEHILWLDLETTGTDEFNDSIIEIGCILTDARLYEISSFTSVVRPFREPDPLSIDPVVWRMHTDNGLWEDVKHATKGAAHVSTEVKRWLVDNTSPMYASRYHCIPLGGSGVSHFDRRFLKLQMPMLCGYLTYWAFDVGPVRRMFERSECGFRPLKQEKRHRALADARQHLEEWRRYETLIGRILP